MHRTRISPNKGFSAMINFKMVAKMHKVGKAAKLFQKPIQNTSTKVANQRRW